MDRIVLRASGANCARCWHSLAPHSFATSSWHELASISCKRSFVSMSVKAQHVVRQRKANRHFGMLPERMTSKPNLSGSDGVLYEEVFKAFGVTPAQFKQLMNSGQSIRCSKGGLVMQGGQPNDKILLVLHGEATAYRTVPIDSHLSSLAAVEDMDGLLDPNGEGQPVCIYRGKCEKNFQDQDDGSLPVRGSTIGGSAYVDANLSHKPYPCTIRASSDDFVAHQWSRHDLQQTVDQPKMRSLQAAMFHLLYEELVATLHKDMTVTRKAKSEKAESHVVESPQFKQLVQYSIFIAVPFFGFGFADNAIMIICGDAIDAHFGVVLGLSTMAAAGLGNWISDVVGLSLGDAIERFCEKLGLSNGRLTPAQQQLNIAKWTTLLSRCIGISLGCFAGMCPLLFLSPTKKEFREGDLEIYNEIFLPIGMNMAQFADLMEVGKKASLRTGDVIVVEGQYRSKLVLILKGKADAFKPSQENAAVHHTYHGSLEQASKEGGARHEIPIRGGLIGGSILSDPEALKAPYPYQIVATTDIQMVQWELTDLRELLAKDKAIEAALFSLLYSNLRKKVKNDSPFRYKELLQVVVADGVVNEKERQMMESLKKKLNISDEEHYELLNQIGWTGEAWHKGFRDSDAPRPKLSAPPGSLIECVTQLQQASTLISETMESIMLADDEKRHESLASAKQ